MLIPQDINQGRPGFLGTQQFIGVFNFRYTVFLCLKVGMDIPALTTNFGYKVYCIILNFGVLHEF